MNRLNMSKAKEILRLKELGFSYRAIASAVGCGKSVVGNTLKRAEEVGIETGEEYKESELESLLFSVGKQLKGGEDEPDIEYLLAELGKKHVTIQLLWEEYRMEHPNGLMYSRFCERIRKAKKINEISLHKTHKGGMECEVDWAGTKIPYYDLDTKELREASIFVAVLPASSYPFVYAFPNQKAPNWIQAHLLAFDYFGGTPRILIPDCTKTAVIKTDLFDPVLSPTYTEMARFYDIEIVPARAYKPKDKGSVENGVGNVSRRIIAALRNERFVSITAINSAIGEKLTEFVNRPFKKMSGCRKSAFETIDQPALRPLPNGRYELADFKTCKVGTNYHVDYEGFYYSVPNQYRGQECQIRATTSTIEVFISGERVYAHQRRYNGDHYSTIQEHLPIGHQVVTPGNVDTLIETAKKYGDKTVAYFQAMINSSTYSISSYRVCMDILREAKKTTPQIVEEASTTALECELFSGKYFKAILQTKIREAEMVETNKMVEHDNIRGKEAFKGAIYHV